LTNRSKTPSSLNYFWAGRFRITNLASTMDFVAAKANVGGSGNVGNFNLTPAVPCYLSTFLRRVKLLSQPHLSPSTDGKRMSLRAVNLDDERVGRRSYRFGTIFRSLTIMVVSPVSTLTAVS
jgi:hypothetical protein